MQVFSIQAFGNYCFGMAVVAAKDSKQAIKLVYKASEKSVFAVQWDKNPSVKILPVVYEGKAMVLDIFASGE
jgi:hypothetical protein